MLYSIEASTIMNQQELNELTDKINKGIATDDELRLFTAYMNQITSPDDSWDSEKLGNEDDLKQEMHNLIMSKIAIPNRFRLWTRLSVAASIILGIGLWFFIYKNHSRLRFNHQIITTQIRPGSNKAILTLGDGTKIILNDANNGTLAHQGSTKIDKISSGKLIYEKNGGHSAVTAQLFNTMTTPRGGQYQVTLPDGTQVWLNAESSITYPTVFAGIERVVTITGEAYFEVAKNKKMPFYVRSGEQTIRVLGTHFNVNSYRDEDGIKTTLLEGSVKVFLADQKSTGTVIKPGEQADLKDGGFSVSAVDTDGVIAWKNGIISFNNADIKSIMRQLSRWYDVEVKYESNLPERVFTGEIPRTADLSEVFKILQLSHINFKVEGRTVIVSP